MKSYAKKGAKAHEWDDVPQKITRTTRAGSAEKIRGGAGGG